MKKILLVSIILLTTQPFLRAAGGPDAYGYTWLTSADPGGPAVQFIDISGFGTLVSGLADDNSSSSMVNIGFPFHFYWTDYNQMKIGSNGWASFSNTSNIASCFPNIPTAGGADSYLAALMSDLNFTGAGNPGQVYTYTNNTDTFIIMYKNVPYWSVNAPGYTGSNSFEIILCAADSSITFQYGSLSPFLNNAACNDMIVGIENSTGSIGLQVFADSQPSSSFAIKFIYPPVVLIQVPDIASKWNQNIDNQAIFVPTGNFNLISNIKNTGNAYVTTSITSTGTINNLALTNLYTSNFSLPTGLPAGVDSTITYSPLPNITTPGEYYFQNTISNISDINSGNNTITTEMDLVDICTANLTLGYTSAANSDASINWNGGANDDGVAVHMIPPVYPVIINQVEVYVASNINNGLLVEIYADDGPANTHGTLLYSGNIPSGSIISNGWNTLNIPAVNIGSGGYYIAFYQTGTNIFIGSTTTGPKSRRNYEILDGGWAPYRYNETQDLMIRCNLSNPSSVIPSQPTAILGASSICAGASAVYNIVPVANANSYSWTLPGGWTGNSNSDTILISSNTNGGVLSVIANGTCGSSSAQTLNITVNGLPIVGATATEDTLCSGEQTILSGVGANSFVWTGGVIDAVAFTPVSSGTYTVTGTDANTCSNTSTIDIVVNPLPPFNVTASDTVLCNGDFAVVNFSGADVYTWGGVSATSTILFIPTGNISVIATGTENINGCTATDTIHFTVHSLPLVDFNYTGNATICITAGVQTLNGGIPMGGTYAGTGVIGSNFDPSLAGIGSHTITYSYTDGNGCSKSDSTTLTVIGCNGIDPTTGNIFNIYPNPFTDVININGMYEATQVSLYNAWGQELNNWILNQSNAVIPTIDLKPGIYFFKLSVGNKTSIEKLIKQ